MNYDWKSKTKVQADSKVNILLLISLSFDFIFYNTVSLVIIFSQPSFSCSMELFGHFPVVNQWSENWIEFFFQTPEDSPMETCLAILLAGMSQVEELLEENRAKKSITAFMSANSRAIPAAVHLLRLFRPSNKIQWRGRSLVNPAMEDFIYRYYSWGKPLTFCLFFIYWVDHTRRQFYLKREILLYSLGWGVFIQPDKAISTISVQP